MIERSLNDVNGGLCSLIKKHIINYSLIDNKKKEN